MGLIVLRVGSVCREGCGLLPDGEVDWLPGCFSWPGVLG